MTTLNELKLKKGDTLFIYGNWNGDQQETIDFFIQEYTIHSIGKIRCYLIYNNNVNTKKEYSSTLKINAALTLEDAAIKCKEYQAQYSAAELKNYDWRINNSTDKRYIDLILKMRDNLIKAPQRVLLNPYITKP